MKYTLGWVIIIGAFFGLEGLALLDPGTGDTFSEHVWALLSAFPFLWPFAAGGLVWAGVHLLRRNRI